jgi:Icc-related predicted phosphoesterase
MSGKRINRILCVARTEGSEEAARHVADAATAEQVDAIALLGDLSGDGNGAYRELFTVLGETGIPAYWVPGPGDAPVGQYLREAHNMEVVFPHLRGVHGVAALAPDRHVLFAGFGGEVCDDAAGEREEAERLSYPGWEAEYRLKMVREFDDHQLVMLFCTPPAHKGLGDPGSETLAELIGTHRPRVAVCAGPLGWELIGRSLIVTPGRVADGEYAIVELQSQRADLQRMAVH